MASSEEFVEKMTVDLAKDTGYQTVDGIKYLTLGLSDVAEELQKVGRLEVQTDDVLQVGFPRSGNHWLLEITTMILRQSTTPSDQTLFSSLLELQRNLVEKMVSPRLIPTHLRMHRLPRQAVQKGIKILYVIRNPKDALVSMYRIVTQFNFEASRFTGTWDEFFQAHMAGATPLGFWFDHVLEFDKFMEEHPHHPTFVCSYEKLLVDPVATIKKLCSFLDKPDTMAEEIAAATEFNIMKKSLTEGKMSKMGQFYLCGTIDPVLYKGGVYGWKKYFTVAQSEQFDHVFEEKMAGCAMGDFVRDYMK